VHDGYRSQGRRFSVSASSNETVVKGEPCHRGQGTLKRVVARRGAALKSRNSGGFSTTNQSFPQQFADQGPSDPDVRGPSFMARRNKTVRGSLVRRGPHRTERGRRVARGASPAQREGKRKSRVSRPRSRESKDKEIIRWFAKGNDRRCAQLLQPAIYWLAGSFSRLTDHGKRRCGPGLAGGRGGRAEGAGRKYSASLCGQAKGHKTKGIPETENCRSFPVRQGTCQARSPREPWARRRGKTTQRSAEGSVSKRTVYRGSKDQLPPASTSRRTPQDGTWC